VQEAELRAAIDEVSNLVRADGGDIEITGVDVATGAVRARLLIDTADCADCILPRHLLEEIVTGRLRRSVPGVRTVSIEDPREGVGFASGSD
jgi:Fe-S cluster biogenesis protein NfuA